LEEEVELEDFERRRKALARVRSFILIGGRG